MRELVSWLSGQTLTVTDQLQFEPQLARSDVAWQSPLEEPLRSRAQKVAFLIAEKMSSPDFVDAVAEKAIHQSVYPLAWEALSLSSGYVGVALMYGYFDRCFPGQSWHLLAQRYLKLVASATWREAALSPSLFSGTSGLALTLTLASGGGQRYQKTLARLHQGISERVLARCWRRPASDGGVVESDYDILWGASGVLAYLVSIEQPDSMVQKAIAHLLEYMTWLAEPGQPLGQERWYVPPALLPAGEERELFSQGLFHCGLAHGIAGPLAALALTWLAGYRYPGLRESIAYVSDWIVTHQVHDAWGINWPATLPYASAADPVAWRNIPLARCTWCRGAVGIARSLWLAGRVLEDERLRSIAVEAIEAVLLRPVLERRIPSSTLCHGIAGLLQVCLRFAQESESELIQKQVPTLVQQILDAFHPDAALGFYDLDNPVPLEQPGWLFGAAGTATALLAVSTSVTPTWDRAFLLA